MTKTSLLVAVVLAASAGVASAGGQAGSLGVGAEYQLSGLGGASVNYDAGQFHFGGLLGMAHPRNGDSTIELGARFFYHLHSTAMSDFGIGGNFGVASVPFNNMMNTNRHTDVFLEPGFQIRVFLAANVALSFTAGLTIGLIDSPNDIAITGQAVGGNVVDFGGGTVIFNGGAGIHYYFF